MTQSNKKYHMDRIIKLNERISFLVNRLNYHIEQYKTFNNKKNKNTGRIKLSERENDE